MPFLLAIILYYALFPAVRRLTLAGIEREKSAAIVAGVFFVVAVLAMVPTLPWLAAQAVSGEEAVQRYLAGGQALLDRTLAMLESQFAFLKRVQFHAQLGKQDRPVHRLACAGPAHRHAARRGGLAARPAARALSRVLLPARRPALPQVLHRRGAQRLLRADALHGRSRRRHGARLLSGTAEAHRARHDLPRPRARS